tara:strand:+ start:27 stop:422 length:396 start_codon:yes stop_codon:yes gene_type:complete
MSNVTKEIDNYFKSIISEKDERSRQYGVYQFYLMLGYKAESAGESGYRGLEDIVADIRAIPSVTVVTIMVKNQKISETDYIAGLKIKFIPSLPGSIRSPEDAKSSILRLIKSTRGVRKLFKVSQGFEKTTV